MKIFEDFEGVTENIKNNVKNIMYIAQQVSRKGFNDMKEGGVEEILTEMALEPTNKYLEETAKHGIGVSDDKDSDKSQPKTPRTPSHSSQNIRMEFCLRKKFQ